MTFHPLTKELDFSGGNASAPPTRDGLASVNSVQFDQYVDIAMLDINLMDFGASDVAYVRFFLTALAMKPPWCSIRATSGEKSRWSRPRPWPP